VVAIAPPAQAQAREYRIPAGGLKPALDAYARQSGLQVIYKVDEVRRARSAGARGSLSAEAALASILTNTGFRAQRQSSGAIAIVQGTPVTASPAADGDDGNALTDSERPDIVITGSRIARTGFDQPTPTTVLGGDEIRQSGRSNIAEVLNDQPQFRPSNSAQTSAGNTGAGTLSADLRGLGIDRTLTLVNGRRFVGQNNLNYVPVNLVERMDVVTGGASAAYGSGAVAGVLNIILKDDLQGVSIGGQSGISARGDAKRYGFDATFGTHFGGGNGHFMIGAEYVDEKGIPSRNDRRNLGSAGLAPVPGRPGAVELVRDVNNGPLGPYSNDGLILTGVLAGQNFNRDGSLRPFMGPDARGIGGTDGRALFDDIPISIPAERYSVYGRATYDIGNARIWADATYARVNSRGAFFPNYLASAVTALGLVPISADNPFLSQAIRDRLSAAGETSFLFNRIYSDMYMLAFDTKRAVYDGAIGITGTIGNGWKYSAHYGHGEIHTTARLRNTTRFPEFLNAIDAVAGPNGPVCRINADADPNNNDPACAALNPFGQGNASAAALAYTRGDQLGRSVDTLDTVFAQIQGDLFSLWAGPITAVVGVEARWEKTRASNGALDQARAFDIPGVPITVAAYSDPTSGRIGVKEGFAEVVAPVLDIPGSVALDLNGAARYSDYSTSGGIWSWKIGGTARLFGDLLLRATRSRDIRSPGISELFGARNIRLGTVVDQDPAGRAADPLYNPTPFVTTLLGGNPDLVPEIGKTLTFGATYQPSSLRGLSLSVDYYDIELSGAITTLNGSDLTAACANGIAEACAAVTRDQHGTITQVVANARNIAAFTTRGIDFEASYATQLSAIGLPGSLRVRALANHLIRTRFDTGTGGAPNALNYAGVVGDSGSGLQVNSGGPKWRGVLSLTYQDDGFGFDTRIRYVGGGKFNPLLNGADGDLLVNNDIGARTYVDIGAQFRVRDSFTLFGNINNLFDVAPPLTVLHNIHYDVVGRYFTVGARVNF
jgi:outer membrane receptor protein involved in Fe transport